MCCASFRINFVAQVKFRAHLVGFYALYCLVLVNGATAESLPVISGVPKDWCWGHFCFLVNSTLWLQQDDPVRWWYIIVQTYWNTSGLSKGPEWLVYRARPISLAYWKLELGYREKREMKQGLAHEDLQVSFKDFWDALYINKDSVTN